MPESVDGGRAEESVGERISPLRKIKIAGDKGGCALMPFGNKVVQVLILGAASRIGAESLTKPVITEAIQAAMSKREMQMKHLGMFVERKEVTGKDGGAIETRKTYEGMSGVYEQLAAAMLRVQAEPCELTQ